MGRFQPNWSSICRNPWTRRGKWERFLNGTLRLASNFKSKFLVTVLVVLIGINGNLIGDAAFVVFPPLIAILYMNLGRNPLAGLFTAYASVACGFGASLVVGNGDAMLAGMTETAAQLVDKTAVVSPASGYYFMLASTLIMSPIIAWVSIRFVEKSWMASVWALNPN